MRTLRHLAAGVRALLQRDRVDAELDEELDAYLAAAAAEKVRAGMAPDAAARAARAEIGSVAAVRDHTRGAGWESWLEAFVLDLRYAWRTMWRRAAFGLAAAGMIGVGIGITTAMFTVVDALILRPVPFHEPEQLAFVYMGSERGGRTTVAPAVLRAWRESRAFAAVESAEPDTALVEVGGSVVGRGIARVTPGIFGLLQNVQPIRGRLFDQTEGRAGADDRVLLSEDVWRGLYNGDPGIVGRRIAVDGEQLTVVGILPAELRFPSWDTVLWRPVDFDHPPPARANDRPRVYVRFAAGIPRADALRIATDAARSVDATTATLVPRVTPVSGLMLDKYYQVAVPLLAGGVVLVFLVLCANVCGLLLARVTARRREFSMRAALGASRRRLFGQALLESAVIGACGMAAGIAVAWALVSAARGLLPEAFLLRTLNPVNLDLRALAVTSASAIVATFAAGLLPAWMATRVRTDESLRVSDRGWSETRGARMVTQGLLVVEIALACTLLVGATLLVRSFVNLAQAERGLDTRGVMSVRVFLPPHAFPDADARATAARLLQDHVRALPGVQHVAWSYGLPPRDGIFSLGQWRADGSATGVDLEIDRYLVGPDFFALYGIPLLQGRAFGPADTAEAVVVGERFANALWPGENPVGRSFSFDRMRFDVVGVAAEIHHPSLDAGLDRPEFWERLAGVGTHQTMMISVRCGNACPGAALVRQRLTAAHPAVEVSDVGLLDETYLEQLARPRATAALGFAFAAIAVLAAAGGLFSVLSYAVARRRREFGIRTALGASPVHIRRSVLRDGGRVAAAGTAFGLAGAAVLARSLASLQYGVTVSDPLSWSVVIGVLGLTAVAAAWRPAADAMRVDPSLLLREE